MTLSPRKEKIIQAVVDSYVDSCEPVSSSDIQDKYLPMLSTATIRNELKALEEMGYLGQPHTSAGRIPTVDAYKLYVEKLMPKKELSNDELNIVKKYFDKKITEIDDLLHGAAKVISEITNMTSVAFAPSMGEALIRSIKIVKITESTALVIVVTNLGVLKDTMVTVDGDLPEEYFAGASNFISASFAGRSIKEVCEPEELIAQITDEFRKMFDLVVEILRSYVNGDNAKGLVLEGSSKLLEQPEYSSAQKAKSVLKLIESDNLTPTLASGGEFGININVTPSADDETECAIVTANLSAGGVNLGKAGVIGPIRMDYSKIASVLEYIEKTVSDLPVGKEEK